MTVGTAAVPMGTAGYCGYCGYCTVKSDSWVLRQYPRVLPGTVGTAGTVRKGYCRVLHGYCRVLHDAHIKMNDTLINVLQHKC